MRESIGSVALYNFIIVFIVVVFGLIAIIVNYYKAFKVNSVIANSIEKFEGYNELSAQEIENSLDTIGYMKLSGKACPKKNGVEALRLETVAPGSTTKYSYCIYEFQGRNVHSNHQNDFRDYYSFGVITYMYVDVPIINSSFSIPVYSKTDSYYRFHIDEYNDYTDDAEF